MKFIKKIDIFVFKAYSLLFVGTFFICLFIFMMQFMWRYVDELIGKGLTLDVLAHFFYYAGLTLIPMSLPLAILLASLITFGNLGERFELLSMKAAGIPLIRILQPIIIFNILLCIGSFYFQNVTGPEAQKKFYTLIYSMKQKSPELEIPEGIFYSEIPGYNIFVEKKGKENGMLYGVMIYSTTDGYEDAQIVLADSAELKTTADEKHLMLTMYAGERFRNMQAQGNMMARANVPYMRETFIQETDLIPFDNNFNMMDANVFSGSAQTKNLREIETGLDSLAHKSDSIGRSLFAYLQNTTYRRKVNIASQDSAKIARQTLNFDTLYSQLTVSQQQSILRNAMQKSTVATNEYEFRGLISKDIDQSTRTHWVEWHKKFTLSLACLFFFFIGAPLGAIIRKGGLGVPVIIHAPDYPVVKTELTALSQEWQAYAQKSRLRLPPNYLHIFFHNIDDHEVISLSRKMENLITILSNSRDAAILDALNKLPIVSTHAHTRPFHNYKWNMVLGIIFPVGIFFYFRIWRYRLRLYKDIQQIKKYSAFIAERIEKISEIE